MLQTGSLIEEMKEDFEEKMKKQEKKIEADFEEKMEVEEKKLKKEFEKKMEKQEKKMEAAVAEGETRFVCLFKKKHN